MIGTKVMSMDPLVARENMIRRAVFLAVLTASQDWPEKLDDIVDMSLRIANEAVKAARL